MFQGKVKLFKGLIAEKWVKNGAYKPSPVISFSMPVEMLNMADLTSSIRERMKDVAANFDVNVHSDTLPGYYSTSPTPFAQRQDSKSREVIIHERHYPRRRFRYTALSSDPCHVEAASPRL